MSGMRSREAAGVFVQMPRICGQPHIRGLCPSCQARRAQEWALWLPEERLERVPHHHVVFTIPKMLRACFRFDRLLLNDLSRAAHRTILTYCRVLLDKDVSPGLIIARHTFGEGVRYHPHLHGIITGGGWSEDCTWQPIFGWDWPVLRKLFQIEVFRFLRHLKWRPGEALLPTGRSPPAVLKVAESLPSAQSPRSA